MSGDRTYYIDFNTKEAPGLIKATRVVLGSDLVRDDKHTFKINLCDDPLYPHLVRYVLNNPPRKEQV